MMEPSSAAGACVASRPKNRFVLEVASGSRTGKRATARIGGHDLSATNAQASRPQKNPPRDYRGGFPEPLQQGSGASAGEKRALREDDLDAPVLRLAHAERRGNPRIVHAATGDDHFVARHAHPFEGDRHGVCAPL